MSELDYKKLYEEEKKNNDLLKAKNDAFSLPSKAKLFYALNRQQNDLADMLNAVELKNIDISSNTDKSVERLQKIWSSIGTLAPIVDSLRLSANLTGDEVKDMATRKPFVETIADKRA
jgi:hypothetical protein